MTNTFNNTIQSPPPKRRKLAGIMSSSTPSLQPSALDRTRSLRKPTSTARLIKDTTATGAVGTSAGSSTTRGAGVGAPKQRPVSMIQMPSTTKGALPAPGTASRTVATSSMSTAISGSGIKRMASVTGTRSDTNYSNIKPPASGGINRLASTRLKREGGKLENAAVGTGAEVGTVISGGSGSRVGSGAAKATLPPTSTATTKSTTSTISSLRQPLRARAPTVSATGVTTKATPLSPPTTTPRSVSGPFGMTRPTTSSSSGSLATITSPSATPTSGSSSRIGTGIGLGGRGHARTQSATISSPKPTTPKPVPRRTAVSGLSTTASSKSALGKDTGFSGVGSGSEPPKSASKGVQPPNTPGKSRPQSLVSTNVLRRSPATATPKTTTTGGTPKAVTGTGLRSSPAHKRQNSASSVSTTGTATTTGTKTRTAANTATAASTATVASTATTQTRRLAASRRPLSLQAPQAAIANIVKLAPKILSSTRPPATAAPTTTVAKPPSRQPNPTASSSTTTTKTAVPKPETHLPGPSPHPSTSSHAAYKQQQQQQQQQYSHPRHDFDTYQQHYTPAKIPLAPKPLTSSFLAPPTPSKQPANVALSAEISRLQTELLQLHLLHREAERVRGEWEGDARGKLKEKFERVSGEERTVGEMEGKGEEDGVVEGLLGMAGFGGKLEETKIQALDEVISRVWAMSELSSSSSSSGVTIGKYTRVVRRFEVWAERAGRILEERRRSAADNGDGGDGGLKLDANGEVEMIGGLDVEWKNGCVALGRRLEEWRRMLGELGGVLSKACYGSSFRSSRPIKGVEAIKGEADKGEEREDDESPLDRILNGFGSLVDNMLAELEIMQQIEREAVAEENKWVRRMNRVDDEKEGEEIVGKRAGAIWRAF